MKNEDMQNVINRLHELNDEQNPQHRAALATLRRALSGETSDVMLALRYVGYSLPPYPVDQDICIMLVALFAHHPLEGGEGNMGNHMADLIKTNPERARGAARRFTELVSSHPADLSHNLYQVISLLKSGGIPINWLKLLQHIDDWNYESQYVQRDWANAFWRTKEVAAALHRTN